MKHNMGTADRIIRSAIGVLLIALYITGVISGTIGIVLLAVSGILLLTGIVGFCPFYVLTNISTCKRTL